MRQDKWGKLTNNQVMGGVKTIDMRAHGTQKIRQSHVLTQNKNTSTWPAKQNHQPCSKQRGVAQKQDKGLSWDFPDILVEFSPVA